MTLCYNFYERKMLMANYELSNRIYELRTQKGLSQKELGAILGVSNKAVSKWETGTAIPKTETLIKLAEVFEISTEEFLNFTREEKEARLPTFAELSAETEQLLKKEKLVFVRNEPKNSDVKSARLYLMGLVIMLVISGLLSVGITISVPDLSVDPHPFFEYTKEDITFLIIASMAIILGAYSGIYGFFKLIRKMPSWACVLFGVLFIFIFGIVIWVGFIMTIPFIIIAIRNIVLAKRGVLND